MSKYFDDMLPIAEYVSSKTGVHKSVLLAQMAHETAYGTSKGAKTRNNHAGLSWFKEKLPSWSKAYKKDNRPANEGGSYLNYKSVWDFAEDYIHYLKNGYYDEVLDAGSVEDQVKALGQSPWAFTHYKGSGKYNFEGGNIQAVIDKYNLTKYDDMIIVGKEPKISKSDVFTINEKTPMLLVVGASALILLGMLGE